MKQLIFLFFPFLVCTEALNNLKTIILRSKRHSLPNNYDSYMPVYGQFWLLKKLGLGHSASYSELGDLYVKKGASLASIHRF